jgi:hypothetical protein
VHTVLADAEAFCGHMTLAWCHGRHRYERELGDQTGVVSGTLFRLGNVIMGVSGEPAADRPVEGVVNIAGSRD